MRSGHEQFQSDYECRVVKRRVTVSGSVARLFVEPGKPPVQEARTFRECTGMQECKIFDTPHPTKETGCPYCDEVCGGSRQ